MQVLAVGNGGDLSGGDYKDGLIREYSDPTFLNGEVKDSKLMWALGNYSRFIRPGAVRKAIIAKDNQGKIILKAIQM